MIPNPMTMALAVRALEAHATRLGWDGRPALGFLVATKSDDAFLSGLFPYEPGDFDPDVSVALRTIADRLREDRRIVAPVVDADSLCAFWVSFEGMYEDWGRQRVLRTVLGIDCGGVTYVVTREPGGTDPDIDMFEPGQETGMGEVCTGLRDILLQAVADLPAITADLAQIAKVDAW